jgi:DNA-binding GntR family transcriptional regulator
MFGQKKSDDGTVVAMLASALRRDISFGTLRPDQKLKIEELRGRYGGSNHSMRETLRLLSAEGLVEATAQRGFRVTSATEDDLRDIALVRKEIEKAAIRRAIEFGDAAWEGRVLGAHHELRRAEEAVAASPDDLVALEWDEACRAFFATILYACGSPRLLDMHEKYFDQSRRFRLAQLREGQLNFDTRKARQQALLNAILEKDPKTAEELIAEEIEAELYP